VIHTVKRSAIGIKNHHIFIHKLSSPESTGYQVPHKMWSLLGGEQTLSRELPVLCD